MSSSSDDESSDDGYPSDYELRYEPTDSNTTKASLVADVRSGVAPQPFMEPPHEGKIFEDEGVLQNSLESFNCSTLRQHSVEKVPKEVDIDMIRGSGSLNMLKYFLTPNSIVNVGGFVEDRADFPHMTCLVTSPFQIWIPHESKQTVFQHFYNFRKGYAAIHQKPHLFSLLQYNMIGADLRHILESSNVTKVVFYTFGMKASLDQGTQFINFLRRGDNDCDISYDIAAYQPIPENIMSAYVRPTNNTQPTPVTPLTRLNEANISEKLGSQFEVINKPHTFATQLTSSVGDNPAHNVPTFGTFNVERTSYEDSTEANGRESSVENSDSHRIFGSDKLLLCKAYSTLIHGTKVLSRFKPHKTTSAQSASNQVKTLLDLSNSSFVLRTHFLRFELTVRLPSHEELADFISDNSIDLDKFHSHAWGPMMFLMTEQETLWLSSVDVAYDMYMSCLAVSSYSKYFLPPALRYLDFFHVRKGTSMLGHSRKFFSLVLANCGIHTDRYVFTCQFTTFSTDHQLMLHFGLHISFFVN